MASSLAGIKQLAERANRLETTAKKRKAEEKITMDKVVGFGSAFVTSAISGYIDGRFDLSDGKAGDGTRIFGIPVVPVGAAILAVGGMAVGGKVGSALAYSGLGAACGWSYSASSKKGLEAA